MDQENISDKNGPKAIKEMLTATFKIKDVGKLKHFLGIDFDQGNGYVKNVSEKKCREHTCMVWHDCKPSTSPTLLVMQK